MRRARADPPPEAAEVAEEVAVERGEGAALEGELGRAVVREERVRVLEEGDEDEPVVDPEVGREVEAEDVREAEERDGVPDGDGPEEDADVGEDDLEVLVWLEDRRGGVEVWWVLEISRRSGS